MELPRLRTWNEKVKRWSLNYAQQAKRWERLSMHTTLIGTNVATAGLQINVIKRLAFLTILLTKELSEPWILTGIYMEYQSQMKCLTLQINYEFLPKKIKDSSILYSTARLPAPNHYGVGDRIRALISTATIFTVLSLSKAIKMVRRSISRY